MNKLAKWFFILLFGYAGWQVLAAHNLQIVAIIWVIAIIALIMSLPRIVLYAAVVYFSFGRRRS